MIRAVGNHCSIPVRFLLSHCALEVKFVEDFRRIPLGDINLERQLYLDSPQTDRASFRRKRSSVRIVRSAKVDNREFTVAMYQGDNAEREWKEDVERYMDIRHESILQLYGTVRCKNIWAAVFHGADLIPFIDFLKMVWHCPILTCYVYGYVTHLRHSADRYLRSTFGRETADCTVLINPSNGRPCIDLESGHDVAIDCYTTTMRVPYWNLAEPLSPMEMAAPTKLTYIVETLTLDQYHEINCMGVIL
ncbi:hypothetical protein R3P38DRAFT_3125099 [Favolaschia claudopus]|uniref:Uncharacterized protein n=1 Tax=Favolaschia claudopus TaxID=2862362 RepID=A0AAV9ZBK9_9AGAR